MASFDGGKNDDHRSDDTNIRDSALREEMISVLKSVNALDRENSTIFSSSYNPEVRSLLKEDAKIVETLSTVERLPILNNIADSTVNKGDSENVQMELHEQWTHTPRVNEGETNMEDTFYTDQVPSTSYQDLGASNVCTNDAIPSTSNNTQPQQCSVYETSNSSFTCTVCNVVRSSKKSLNRHLASEHDTGEYKCDVCERVFAYKYDLNQHISAYQLEIFSCCCMCMKKFRHKKHLTEHKILYHPTRNKGEINMEDTVYTNQVPSTSYRDSGVSNVCKNDAIPSTSNGVQLQQGPAKETDRNSNKCNVCGIVKNSKRTLNSHLANVHFRGRYKCDVCQWVFADQSDLTQHISAYKRKISFVCCMCMKTFRHEKHLEEHKKNCHLARKCDSPTSCMYCKQNSTLKKI